MTKPMTKDEYRAAKLWLADPVLVELHRAPAALFQALAWMEAAKPLLERLNDIDHISTHDLEVTALLETFVAENTT